jgi:cytochrome c-type biogenesis protein CcmH/NrfF
LAPGSLAATTPLWVVPVALLLVAVVLIGVTYYLDQAVHGGSGTLSL